EKYIELSIKLITLISTLRTESGLDFKSARSMEDIGAKLLKSVGMDEHIISPEMIEAALEANNAFSRNSRLSAIGTNIRTGKFTEWQCHRNWRRLSAPRDPSHGHWSKRCQQSTSTIYQSHATITPMSQTTSHSAIRTSTV